MPKFKNREEYEEWKAEKLQESKEKLTAGHQALSPEKQPTIPSATTKGNIARIGWIGIAFGISLIFLGISIFIAAFHECDAKCVFGALFLIFSGLIMAIVFYLIAREE